MKKTLLLLFSLFFVNSPAVLAEEFTYEEDVRKLCNPQNDEEREAAKEADLFQSCINNGAW